MKLMGWVDGMGCYTSKCEKIQNHCTLNVKLWAGLPKMFLRMSILWSPYSLTDFTTLYFVSVEQGQSLVLFCNYLHNLYTIRGNVTLRYFHFLNWIIQILSCLLCIYGSYPNVAFIGSIG